jgi:cyclic-di-GMP phosphodiesterase TipF (flagellum assembly factor)
MLADKAESPAERVTMDRRHYPGSQGEIAARPQGRAADIVVALSMGIVVFALATGLNLHLGTDITVALAAGAAVYAVLLGLHAAVKAAARRAASGADTAAARARAGQSFDTYSADMYPADMYPASMGHDDYERAGDRSQPPSLSQLNVRSARAPAKAGQVPLPPLQSSRTPAPVAATTTAPQPRTSITRGHRAFEPVPVSDLAAATTAPAAGGLDADVERMQALVKKLADEMSAVDNAADKRPQPRIYGRPPRFAAAAGDSSVNVLRDAGETVRAAQVSPPPMPQAPLPSAQAPMRPAAPTSRAAAPVAAPPPLSPAQAHIAAVADALVAGRVEVELEPILSLLDQRTRHYEVSVQVRGVAGELLAGNAGFDGLQGSGLLPLFDSARLQRSIGIVQRLAERNKSGRVFSSYSAESLTNASFLTDVRGSLGDKPAVASQLVIGLAQKDVRAFSPGEWAAVAELRHMQVNLALDGMTHLDLDLRQLAGAGFAFARLDAASFLSGLRFGGRTFGGGDLVRYVTGSGMALIVDRIDDELTLQRIAPFNVQLGQGRVFGGRKAVKVAKAGDTAAA